MRIPRFTHSDELVDHVEVRLAELFDLDACTLWLARSADDYPLPELADEASQVRFWSAFGPDRPWWAAAPELNRSALTSEQSAVLAAEGWSLALPLESPRGLLLLGRQRGLLTLEVAEQASRVVRQLEVALEILHLLEQEKTLLEKTMEANLIALRAQINPHFLFNTFNSIAELIHSSPAGAEAALEKLAWIIRYTLRFSKDNFVELGNELTLVRTYLELEQIRFADRLTVEVIVEEGLGRVPMPAFVLQTVVENCIKHGIARVTYSGLVRVQVQRQGDTVQIYVFDNGPGIDPVRIDQGTGLRNIRERLHVLYNRDDLIHFTNTGQGTLVSLRLPVQARVSIYNW
jgi:signal transduction histidine kinase